MCLEAHRVQTQEGRYDYPALIYFFKESCVWLFTSCLGINTHLAEHFRGLLVLGVDSLGEMVLFCFFSAAEIFYFSHRLIFR